MKEGRHKEVVQVSAAPSPGLRGLKRIRMKQFLGWAAIAAMVACLLVACSKDDGVNTDEPEVRLELLVDTVSFKVNGSFYFTEDLVRIDDRRTGAMAGSRLEVRYEVADEEVAQFGFYDWRELYGRGVGETKVYAYLEEKSEVRDSCLVQVLPIEGQGITISAREVELYVEEDTLLRAQVYPMNATYKDVSWSSSDETVATVDESGLVTAVSAGDAVIAAESVDGLTAECRVKVLPAVIEMSELEVEMYVDETHQLAVHVRPDNEKYRNVTWSSSDVAVATVDESGMVMAVAEGEAVVTVESVGGLKAECRVKVLPPVIELSETEMEMYVDETYTLSVTVLPDIDKYRDVTWSSSDETVATVSTTGMVMAISAGEAVITAASVGGLKAECRVTVKNVPVSSVSIPELSEGMGLVAGDELQLTYEVLPENAFNKNVNIYSSNEYVLSIDENLVLHAHAKGNADVVIESEDGNVRQIYNIRVKNITSYLEATSGKSSINIGGISRETVGSTLKNKSAYTVEVVSVAAYRGDEIIRAGGSDMLGSLAPGEERSFDMTASHWAYTPTFIWIIEFRGQLYQMVGGISIN